MNLAILDIDDKDVKAEKAEEFEATLYQHIYRVNELFEGLGLSPIDTKPSDDSSETNPDDDSGETKPDDEECESTKNSIEDTRFQLAFPDE